MNKKSIGLDIIIFILIVILIIVFTIYLKNIIYDKKYIEKVNSITSDSVEIERKWIIDKEKIPYDLINLQISMIEQTYICFSPEIRVRRINNGEEYTFTVKTNMTSDGMIRDEMEINITKEEYENLIKKREGNTILKTRYQFLDGDDLLAIDIFSGELEGLAYLEIEFESEEEANNFKSYDWVIKDVTDDENYKNGHLARYGIPNSFYEYIK